MVFTREFDPKTRFMVVYQDVTKCATRISKLIGQPLRTIYDWIEKINNDEDIFVTAPGRGRKRDISEVQTKKIVNAARKNPQRSSTRSLGARFAVSNAKVHAILKDHGFEHKKIPAPSKALTEDEKDARVDYCRNMLKRRARPIETTFFSDEMGINLSDTHLDRVWMPPRQRIKCTKPKQNVRLNCWGAISCNGATDLYIFKGGLKADHYQDILLEHKQQMDDLYNGPYTFIHDNLSVHTAVEDWAKTNGLNIRDFPTYSPDLNPIENLWSALKYRVACDNPRTEQQMRNSLLRNWRNLTTLEALEPYFEGLKGRYQDCIDKGGGKLDH